MIKSDLLSYYMFHKFDPYNPTILKKILSIRRNQLLDPNRRLSDEDLIYYRGIISGIDYNALFRKEQNIPERYYNMFFGKDTENMHLFISREKLSENCWGNFSDFNSEKGPNVAKESKIIHALSHAIQYAIDDHYGEARNQTAIYPRTGEKCWQEFFSLFEVFNINNNVSGLNTEDIINYDIDGIVGDICKTKPTFRSDIYLCYFGIPVLHSTFEKGYLEVNKTGENLLVSEDERIISKIDNNAVQTILQMGMVSDCVSGISIYLRSKAESFSFYNIPVSTVLSSTTDQTTLSTQVNYDVSITQPPTQTTKQVVQQPTTTNNNKQNNKQQSTTIMGGIVIFDTNDPDGYTYYSSKADGGDDLAKKGNGLRKARTIRKDFRVFLGSRPRKHKNLDNALKSIGGKSENVYYIPTPSARDKANPAKLLTKQILIDHKIDINKFKERVKQAEVNPSSPINYPNIKDW